MSGAARRWSADGEDGVAEKRLDCRRRDWLPVVMMVMVALPANGVDYGRCVGWGWEEGCGAEESRY